jgi:hypothetical protein
MSWRTTVKTYDLSETTPASTAIQGASAIRTTKGPSRWVFWSKGSTQKLLNTYGYPSSSYPDIQDVIDFNNVSGLWVSAPSTTGTYGGVFVTTTGTIPFVNGTSTQTIADYSAIACEVPVAIGDGVTTAFAVTLTNHTFYVAESIDLEVDGTTINITATGSPSETLTTTPDVGGGTLNTATGALSFTFDAAPALGAVLTASYTIDIEDEVYFTLYDQNPQADDVKVRIEKDLTAPGYFYMYVSQFNPVEQAYIELSNSPFYFGLTTTAKDGNGKNVYIGNIFNTDQTYFTATIQTSTFTTFTNDVTAVSLTGGSRGSAQTGSTISARYTELQDDNTYPNIEIMFDGTASTEVQASFDTLRQSYQKYCRFMYCLPDATPATSIANAATLCTSTERGVYVYCLNWGIKKDVYLGNNFICSNMGLIAGTMANILLSGPGGNPAWINENGMGGQLGSSISKLNQLATEDQLQVLDGLRLNPVIFDAVYGPMVVSWRTRQSRLSDFSYIGQSSLADYIIKQVTKSILPMQLAKLNDDYHRSLVTTKCQTILSGLSKWISDSIVICDRTNNTDSILQQQKFVLTMGVVFIPYANTIEFNFIVGRQGIEITEQIVSAL